MAIFFRKIAMKQLSSPDMLDQVVEVVSPRGWIVLFVLIALLIIAILWGIFGSLPTKVSGSCMLIKTGGVYTVHSDVSGKVTDVAIEGGDFVNRGDVILRVEQAKLLNDIYFQRRELEQEMKEAIKKQALEKQTSEDLNKKLTGLKKVKKNKLELFEDGLVTEKSIYDIEAEISLVEKEMKDLEIKSLADQHELETMKDRLEIFLDQYQSAHNIVSPYSGRVLSVDVNYDSVINVGTPLVGMELTGKNISDLESVIYVPVLEGKKIKPGMKVLISPSTIQAGEYGMLKGTVRSVSVFPVTQQYMLKMLGNEKLVQDMSAGGAPIAVEVDLTPNPQLISGYEWTSPNGPPIKINSGTFCQAFITIREQRPISLVIPVLKQALGG